MPRIARPISDDTTRVRDALAKHIRSINLTPNAFAAQCGVSQSTLSRFLCGITKNINPAIKPALRYAGIDYIRGIPNDARSLDNARLREVLDRLSDGSPEVAELLADIIEALVPAVARYARRR
jgi:transcriptional regulator with XRE-family HTH domain